MKKTWLLKTLTLYIISSVFLTIANGQGNYLYHLGLEKSIQSTVLEEKRTFWVQVPPSYSSDDNLSYPICLVLDGSVHLGAGVMAQSYYSGGFFPEMILVGISNTENRTRDLTPSIVKTRYGRPYNEETGGADKFAQFIIEELIPYLDENYKTTSYRTLIGHSYAGLFTINMLLHYKEHFDNYIAIDPSIDWDNQKLLKDANEILTIGDYSREALFISLGGQLHMRDPSITIDNVMQDSSEFTLFPRSNIQFYNLIEDNLKNGLRSKWMFYPNDLHGTIPLPSIVDGLIFLHNWYPIEQTDKFNDPSTPTADLLALVQNRARKLEHYFGYSVPPFEQDLMNMLGYMNLDMGQPDKSLAFFNLNVQYYPESANVYDSKADYFLAQKDTSNAIIQLQIAEKISKSSFHKSKLQELIEKRK